MTALRSSNAIDIRGKQLENTQSQSNETTGIKPPPPKSPSKHPAGSHNPLLIRPQSPFQPRNPCWSFAIPASLKESKLSSHAESRSSPYSSCALNRAGIKKAMFFHRRLSSPWSMTTPGGRGGRRRLRSFRGETGDGDGSVVVVVVGAAKGQVSRVRGRHQALRSQLGSA